MPENPDGTLTCAVCNEVLMGKQKKFCSKGCFYVGRNQSLPIKHGHASNGVVSAAYLSWMRMVARCENPNSKDFPNYGGRGITVSPELRTFEGFYAVLGDRPVGLSLDRIDNNKGYSPDNVHWADRKAQMRNKRSNRLLTFNEETLTTVEWAERTGISRLCIIKRLSRGWSIEKTLTTPTITIRHPKRRAA